jgi:hypothetical protein
VSQNGVSKDMNGAVQMKISSNELRRLVEWEQITYSNPRE